MQLITPIPAFAPCWLTGAMSPTTYWLETTPVTGSGSATMLPIARMSKDGNGPEPGTSGFASPRARPVVPASGPPGRPLSPAVLVPAGATPTSELTPSCGNSIAQLTVLAGICKTVLHGTIMVMPLTVTVPPQRSGSPINGHRLLSVVAAWMKPVTSNCGVGAAMEPAAACALAPPAPSTAVSSATRKVPRLLSVSCAATHASAPRRHSASIICGRPPEARVASCGGALTHVCVNVVNETKDALVILGNKRMAMKYYMTDL